MKVLVTGGTGFLGGALAHRLREHGADITVLGRNPMALASLEAQHIHTIRADLADAQEMLHACRGQELVFHCGALSSPWGRPGRFHEANVVGTENIIRGCEEGRVKRLVYVSTPSIYFGYKPYLDIREDTPLPEKPANEYAHTKRLAEMKITEAFQRGLPVITIRPRAIFGPGDTSLLPRLIDRLQVGGLRIIGSGRNLADLSYVGNVVDALLLCADAPAFTLGKKYNITNGEPVLLWDLIKKIARAIGAPVPQKHIPYNLADLLARMQEVVYSRLPRRPEPPFTRYSVGVLALDFTLDISAARRDLGYRPRMTMEAAIAEVIKARRAAHP